MKKAIFIIGVFVFAAAFGFSWFLAGIAYEGSTVKIIYADKSQTDTVYDSFNIIQSIGRSSYGTIPGKPGDTIKITLVK